MREEERRHHTNKKHKRMTKRQRMRKRRRRLFVIECFALVFLVAFLFAWLKLGLINFDRLGLIAANNLDDKTKEMLEGYTTIAFFGVDNRSNGEYESGNSDSMMICNIDNETKEVKVLSLYRDTTFEVDGDGTYYKCNYAYNHGGPKEAIEMMNRNLDLNIQDYVAVDFNALVEAIDAVGGVEITLTQQEIDVMDEKGYMGEVAYVTGHMDEVVTLSPGTQTVNGVVATAYCRIRNTAGDDFARAERQRTVLTQLIQKAQSASFSELNDLIDGVFPKISTSLSLKQMLGLASAMKDYELVDTCGFPFSMAAADWDEAGKKVVVPCTLSGNVTALYQYLYNESDYKPTETVQSISSYIEEETGLDESDAVDYGYGPEQTETEQTESE